VVKRIGVTLALAGVIAGGFQEPAQAQDRCGNSRGQRHKFYRAARHRLEANRRQARRILRSCRKRRNVPVHGRRVRSARTYTAVESQPGGRCRTVTRGVTYSSSVFLGARHPGARYLPHTKDVVLAQWEGRRSPLSGDQGRHPMWRGPGTIRARSPAGSTSSPTEAGSGAPTSVGPRGISRFAC
jgi:hypothetical protein